MPSPLSTTNPESSPETRWGNLLTSLSLYTLFAAGVFFAMGPHPLLGSDHLTYMRLAEEIAEKQPNGNYLPEINSVRSFSVLLAYLYHFTGSHVLSMKLILAAISVPYLLAAELLFSMFTAGLWKRRLWGLLAGFAVSFGVASWGITDYTALMPRTLVMPVMFFCFWFFLRFYKRAWRYAVFPILVLFSTVHLSTFFCIGVLLIFEVFDFIFLRQRRIDVRVLTFPAWLISALILLLALQTAGVSIGGTSYMMPMLFPKGTSVHTSVAEIESKTRTGDLPAVHRLSPVAPPTIFPFKVSDGPSTEKIGSGGAPVELVSPSTPKEAWQYELANRAWRNMPLPWVNVANIFSSFGLIILLASAGAVIAFRSIPRQLDLMMACLVPAIVLFALGPQTSLWLLRQFTQISPINIEEIRALSFLMIPALYFCIRLFDWLGDQGGRTAIWGRTSVVAIYLALPLTMKSLNPSVRELLLNAMVRAGLVSPSPEAVANARSALGLSYSVPLYYPVEGVSRWLRDNGQSDSLVLTDRDDMLVRSLRFVGSRQEVALQGIQTQQAITVLGIYTRLKLAFGTQDLRESVGLAKAINARYLIVPWTVEKASYRDAHFSVIDLQKL